MNTPFEFTFTNFNNLKKSQKKKKLETLKKKSIKVKKNEFYDTQLFDNNNNYFHNLLIFYSKYDYENIKKRYTKLQKIIIDTHNNQEKKWIYLSSLLLYNVNYFFVYKLKDLIMQGNVGINNFIYKFNKTIKFIENDTNIPSYITEKIPQLMNYKNIIENNTIKISEYILQPLTNNQNLSPFVVKIIDIFNRYFNYISTELNIINYGFYIPNEDKSGDYVSSTYFKLKNDVLKNGQNNLILIMQEINNIVSTINQYREDDYINNFEVKYQIEFDKDIHTNNIKVDMFNKLNFIITYGYYFTYDNHKLLEYMDKKLIEGGNLILVSNMDTPIKSQLFKELLLRFKKSIVTKATLDEPFYWIFIGKGFIQNYKKNNISRKIDKKNKIDKIYKFLNNVFIESCKNFDNFLFDTDNIMNFSPSDIIKNINKGYIKNYKWCLDNNVPAINLSADENKSPTLVKNDKFLSYLFPNQNGVNKNNIKFFDISIYSVTPPKEAQMISLMIKKLLNIIDNNIIITDGTANVGGNTLNFSSNFKKVNSIEYNKETYEGLVYNCQEVYKRENIDFYMGDCIKIINHLKQDVIFIDPPWNGSFYKAYDKIHLKLSGIDVYDIINGWFNKKRAKMYCVKCPFNFDFISFINKFSNIYIQKLKNYNVIYILH
jgi:hypothetical protein